MGRTATGLTHSECLPGSPRSSANDPSREGVAIFMAEGVVCERLGVPIDAAIVVLADMAVTRGLSLLDMAEAILGGATVPAPTPRPASPRRERPAAGSD